MSREGALWIGGLEQYMDEEFLMNAFRTSGEDSILSIKVKTFKINHLKISEILVPYIKYENKPASGIFRASHIK